MKSLNLLYQTIFICLFSGLYSCKRYDPLDLRLHKTNKVTFHLQGFRSSISPFSFGAPSGGFGKLSVSRLSTGALVVKNIMSSSEEQFLYYWSFNAEDLSPDVAIDEEGSAISIDANNPNANFSTGFAFDPYEAGRALSITGARAVEIAMPLTDIRTIGRFEFDVSSSNTGAKDFSLSYSIDGGNTYSVYTASNQFERMGAQARNTYSFDFSDVIGLSDNSEFNIKLEFVAGDREGASPYNANTGVIRLDNMRLSGIYDPESMGALRDDPSYLQFYVFDSNSGALVHANNIAFAALDDAQVAFELAAGNYRIVFLAYHMELNALLPATINHLSDFYFGHYFNDRNALTFGHLIDDFEMGEEERQEQVLLRRLFSNIRFDLEDAPSDLLRVKRLVISRLHDHFLYLPFGAPTSFPLADAPSILLNDPFGAGQASINFHQFIGLLEGARDLEYELTAFGDGPEPLSHIVLSKTAPNNVQVVFSGKLLGDRTKGNIFGVEIDKEWDDIFEEDF